VFLAAFARCWRRGLCCGLPLAALAAAAAWYLLPPPQYSTQALLHIAARAPRVLGNAGEVEGDFQAFLQTQKQFLKTRSLLETALKEPGVRDLPSVQRRRDPVPWLRQKLEVDSAGGPEILRIGLSGDRAEDLPVIVNAVARTYLRDFGNEAQSRREAHLRQLEEVRKKLEARARPAREALNREAPGGAETDPKVRTKQRELELERIGEMKKVLVNQEMELMKLQAKARLRERTLTGGDGEVSPARLDAEVDKNPVIATLVTQLMEAQARLEEGKEHYRTDAEEMQNRAHRVERASQLLKESREKLRPYVVKLLQSEARAKDLDQDQDLQGQLQLLLALRKTMTTAIAEAEARALQWRAPNVDALHDELADTDALIRKVASTTEALNIELLAPPRVTLLEPAELPEAVDSASKIKKTAGAGLAAFALVVFAFTWWEVRAQRIANVQDVSRGLGVPVVATLPALSVSPSPLPAEALPRRHALVQGQLNASVDAASTVLLHAANLHALRVVLISSATPREGKTTLACNLAAGLARAGRKVLLVDGDLRRPSLHRVFDLPPSPGFREVLSGEADLADAVRPTFCPGLFVLPTADWPGSALEVLSARTVPDLFARLKAEYDLVLVDSGPILAACEPLLLGQHADGVVLTVRRNVTTAPAMEAAYQRLRLLGIRVIGAVVNGACEPTYGQGYYYSV
jgi:capsular exopolysaccharide synthesis family protein